MGMCLLSADLLTVGQSVDQEVKALGYVIDRASQFESSTVISGRAERSGKFPVDCWWEARSCSKGTLLTLNMRPARRTLWSPVILFAILSILVLAASAYVIMVGARVLDSGIFVLLNLLVITFAAWFYYAHKKRTQFLAMKESELWQALEQQHPIEKILPVRTSLLGDRLETVVSNFLCLLLCTICMWLAPITIPPFVLFLSTLLPYSIGRAWFRTKPFIQWRLEILKCVLSLAFLSFVPLLFLYIFYAFHIATVLHSAGVFKTPSRFLKAVMLKENNIRLSSRGTTDPKIAVKEIAQIYVDEEVSKLSQTLGGSPRLLKHFQKLVTAKLVSTIDFIVMLYMLVLMGATVTVIRAPWDWQEACGKTGLLPFRIPAVPLRKRGRGLLQQVFLGIFLTNYGVLNLVSLFASVEILHFILTGRTFLHTLGYILGWISLPRTKSMITVSNPPYLANPSMGIAVLLLFAVPALIIPVSKIFKLIKSNVLTVWAKLKLLHHAYIMPQDLRDTVRVLSLKAGVPTPILKLLFESKIRLFVRKRLWQRNARIYVTTIALEKLGPDELEAALAHEISHLQQGLFKVELARFLSWLFFFPNGCWHSLIDFVEREFDADMRAVHLTGKREALAATLVKMSVNIDRPKSKKQVLRHRRSLFPWLSSLMASRRLFNEFLSGDVMVGYTYPHLTERIQAIQAQPT